MSQDSLQWGKKSGSSEWLLHCSTLQKLCHQHWGQLPPCLSRRSLAVIHLLQLSQFHHENPCLGGRVVRQAWTSPATAGFHQSQVLCCRAHPGLAEFHQTSRNVRLHPPMELLLSEHQLDCLKSKMKIRWWFLALPLESSSTSSTDRWGVLGGSNGIFMQCWLF